MGLLCIGCVEFSDCCRFPCCVLGLLVITVLLAVDCAFIL